MNIEEFKKLPALNLPAYELKLDKQEDDVIVFDPIRDKWLILTPEEFVRQHFVKWMVQDLGYPLALMANETTININGTSKRCDTVVFDHKGDPMMIVEYKAPNIKITQETFDQIVRYNMNLKARYLVVSNGLRHYCCVIDYVGNTYNFIPVIPPYKHAHSGLGPN